MAVTCNVSHLILTTYFASNVLSDGRILTIDRQVFPDKGNPMYIILRPDGTKTEIFYKSPEGNMLTGQGLETANGRIVFIEADKNNQATGNVISISYNRPLHSRVNLTADINGDFHSVFHSPQENYLSHSGGQIWTGILFMNLILRQKHLESNI